MKLKLSWLCTSMALFLAGCGGQDVAGTANLSGQVGGLSTPSSVTHYAAARFLEQASMGPSPSMMEQVKAQGIDAWITAQMKLPPTKIITPESMVNYDDQRDKPAADRMRDFYNLNLFNFFIGGEDQLRIRTTWALSNFLVVSTRKVAEYGGLEYLNTLQSGALGQYSDLLKNITLSPAMGNYLDNSQNTKWQLNENYGRELMQLFSVGLVQLNMDGTPKRDANGKVIETYSQKDVIEMTRALTGWNFVPNPTNLISNRNFANYGKPMIENSGRHDTGSKSFLGKTIPAGQTAAQDLDSLVEILVTHPNTAPFVALRLIQGMTTSDPSPAYLQRVATVFKDTKGNLAKVVTAILTDPEARAGDTFGKTTNNFGRIKEPVMVFTSALRGLGCKVAIKRTDKPNEIYQSNNQQPLNANSVFNFFPPNHRTQGTNVLAPEQKLLNSVEFSSRMGSFMYSLQYESALNDAGCDVATFKAAQAVSDEKLMDLMNERFFRGTLSASISKSMIDANKNLWNRDQGLRLVGAYLDMASVTPAFGVSK
ncbi:MAG: DUF1800 domain-containing protein [Betaproteobacteria bacterium]|jgi:uncharacterized protein (DUF1800 family)|nr:DUF1800 domain-containing protein [Betaproteobacteria bacterium]NBZ99451.1 DUF1800 domain-containing protein [Betaproteobacteria bacterium]NDB44598.1 DUF1800 domain-containing protein [Betaproteobacteria bacterium]NDE25132.1 DUF1800 domain-containing protein [Betaproteobacteria bacterium]